MSLYTVFYGVLLPEVLDDPLFVDNDEKFWDPFTGEFVAVYPPEHPAIVRFMIKYKYKYTLVSEEEADTLVKNLNEQGLYRE